MKKGLTDITVVLDRSGSMVGIKDDMEGGLREFVEKQKEQAGECVFSFVKFDTEYELAIPSKNLQDVQGSELVLEPRGGTSLYDALGKTINCIGERLSKLSEEERPEKVLVLCVTDGEENSSKEFTSTMVSDMIKLQTDSYNWDFVYLGANQDAILAASKIGISFAKSMTYDINNTVSMWSGVTTYASGMRCAATAQDVKFHSFSGEDRQNAVK